MKDVVETTNIDCIIFDAKDLYNWIKFLTQFYDAIPGLTCFRKFCCSASSSKILVADKCFEGSNIPFQLVRRKVITSVTKQCYLSLKKTVKISEEKLKNLRRCYNYLKYIDKAINYFNAIVQENKELGAGTDFENDNIIRVAEKLNPSV